MKTLLAQAVNVVECARSLDIMDSVKIPGMYRIACEPRAVPAVLGDIAKAIEAFDQAAADRSQPEATPTAALAVVLRYVADRGVNMNAMMAHVRKAGGPGLADALLDAAEKARELDHVPDLKPKPGEIGAPDDVRNETSDLAAIRTRTGPQDIAPKHAEGTAIREKYDPEGKHEVVLGGEMARKLGELAAALSGKPIDPRHAESGPTSPHAVAKPQGPLDTANYSGDLSTLIDGLTDRVNRLVMKIGRSERLAGLASQFENLRVRLMSETGPNGVVFEMTAGITEALARVETEISKFERDFGVEEAMDDADQPDFKF
jgi:hypothetical protein